MAVWFPSLRRCNTVHHASTKSRLSQEVLGEMIGATRSRVNLFMGKFKKLGFISYGDGLHVNGSLLSVVLDD
jgi:CRP/FNR family cyclic AMP-dependent transcriptional regulator